MNGKFLALAAVGAMAFAFSAASTPASAHHVAMLGNDLPHINGKVEKLHLHAYNSCPSNPHDTTNGNGGNVIALLADFNGRNSMRGANDIDLLVNSGLPNFMIVDGNACDNDPAAFTLPSDALFDEEAGDSGQWAVFVRMRGEPDTRLRAQLCYSDTANTIVCDTGDVLDVTRGNGKPQVTDATRELLGFDSLSSTNGNINQTWWETQPDGRVKATLYFYDCDDLVAANPDNTC